MLSRVGRPNKVHIFLINVCYISSIRFSTGNFASCEINLSQNDLTRFESAVFMTMLEEMYSSPTDDVGRVKLTASNNLILACNG